MSAGEPCPLCGRFRCYRGDGGGITLTPYDIPATKTPHKCPICKGSGKGVSLIPKEQSTATANDLHKICHGCNGNGIVWES